MDIRFYVLGYTIAGEAFLRYTSEPYRTSLPATAQQPIEIMTELEILDIIPRISANMEVTFEDENGLPVAGGMVHVFFEQTH